MKLSQPYIHQAQQKLNSLSNELISNQSIKSTIRQLNKKIQTIFDAIKQSDRPQAQKIIVLSNLCQNILIPKIIQFDWKNKFIAQEDQKTKSQRQKLIKERLRFVDEIDKYKDNIEQIKRTIAQIKKTVQDSKIQEQNKRKKIEADLQVSLQEIRGKITTQEKQSVEFQQQNVKLLEKSEQLKKKLGQLQNKFQSKAAQKDQQVRVQKQQLLQRLKLLEEQTAEISKINSEYTAIEKKNFDNKLTLHIKQTKFNQYAANFQNTGKLINQCKEELFKAVARLNQSKSKKQKYEKDAEQFDKTFLSHLGTNEKLKTQIEKVKKSKEGVRARILEIQQQIKIKKDQQ